MSVSSDPSHPETTHQREMYRQLREEAARQARRRQQKIERLVAQHGQRDLRAFRRPSR